MNKCTIIGVLRVKRLPTDEMCLQTGDHAQIFGGI